MSNALRRADFGDVTSSRGDDEDRGAAIKRRFDALGISEREWHAKTGIDRKTLHRAIENQAGTRSSTYDAIERNLDKLEDAAAGKPSTGLAAGDREGPRLVRFKVEGVYGAKAYVLEGEPEDRELLESMLDRIMRNLHNQETNKDDDASS